MRSPTDFTGSSGFTTRMLGDCAARITGAKSFTVSYGIAP